MAQEAPAVFDLSDEELERRRQSLSYAVIWGKQGVSPELERIEHELDRRARVRAEERRSQAQAARDEAWRRMQEQEERRQADEAAFRAAEEQAERKAEDERRQKEERQRAHEERMRQEEERRRKAEEERLRLEEEERHRAEMEHRHKEEQLRELAAEQIQTARLLDYGTRKIVELAQSYVQREDVMNELATAESVISSLVSQFQANAGEDAGGAERFDQAQRLLGAFLRARLAAIPSLRLKPDPSPGQNGASGPNGKRSTLEGQTRTALADLLPPPDEG